MIYYRFDVFRYSEVVDYHKCNFDSQSPTATSMNVIRSVFYQVDNWHYRLYSQNLFWDWTIFTSNSNISLSEERVKGIFCKRRDVTENLNWSRLFLSCAGFLYRMNPKNIIRYICSRTRCIFQHMESEWCRFADFSWRQIPSRGRRKMGVKIKNT